jgi:hypothetical protein
VEDVDALFNAIVLVFGKLPPSKQVVVVTDWRFCPMMSSDASDRLLQRMTGNNPRTERSAALASRQSPVAVLQFLRLVRESGHPSRKMFFDPDASGLVDWLGQVLTSEETARLRQFLNERMP